jgi:transcriptional regulator with XRE-family HTH domain
MATQSFADFLNSVMREKGWASRDLAERARSSFRTISDARSGKLEESLNGNVSIRKKAGLSSTVYRILCALGCEPREWMDKLGLEIPESRSVEETRFEHRLRRVLKEPVTAEDIERFGQAQKALGDLFSVEIMLQIIMRGHLEV